MGNSLELGIILRQLNALDQQGWGNVSLKNVFRFYRETETLKQETGRFSNGLSEFSLLILCQTGR